MTPVAHGVKWQAVVFGALLFGVAGRLVSARAFPLAYPPMPQLAPHTPPLPSVIPEMLTLMVDLHSEEGGQQLALAVAKPEWLGLVSNFVRMPADERMRVGHSIQAALARSPFPAEGMALSPADQHACDSFVGDCVLLAALAEATTMRVLQGTAVAAYKISHGNAVKAQLH